MNDKRTKHELHIALWDWLAKNPGNHKSKWPEWEFNGGSVAKVPHLCFCCKLPDKNSKEYYLLSAKEMKTLCDTCNIKEWGGTAIYCDDYSSYYENWRAARDCNSDIEDIYTEIFVRNAELIRDLKWTE